MVDFNKSRQANADLEFAIDASATPVELPDRGSPEALAFDFIVERLPSADLEFAPATGGEESGIKAKLIIDDMVSLSGNLLSQYEPASYITAPDPYIVGDVYYHYDLSGSLEIPYEPVTGAGKIKVKDYDPANTGKRGEKFSLVLDFKQKLPRQENAVLDFTPDLGTVVELPERGSPEALELNFTQEHQSVPKLEFDYASESQLPTYYLDGAATVAPDVVTGLVIQQRLPSAQIIVEPTVGTGTIEQIFVPSGDVTLVQETVTADSEINYDINVDRNPKLLTGAGSWASKAKFQDSGLITVKHAESGFESTRNEVKHGEAIKAGSNVFAFHKESAREQGTHGGKWQESKTTQTNQIQPWENPGRTDHHRRTGWINTDKNQVSQNQPWTNPGKSQRSKYYDWQVANREGISRSAGHQEADQCRFSRSSLFEQATYPPHGVRPEPPVIVPPVEPTLKDLDFRALRQADGHLEFVFIELDALIIMNEITVKHVAPDGTETQIHPTQARVGIDLDSYTWKFSGELKGTDALQFLRPQGGESPVIKLEVNGWDWIFVVDSFNRNRGTFNVSYSFQADSQTRYLGEPHALKVSDSVDSTISPWQMVEQRVNPLGFNLERQAMIDWTIRGGSYSYSQLTPIALLKAVTAAVGGIVRPDREAATLTVQPRYKVSPWKWGTMLDSECDHLVPESVVVTEAAQDTSTQQVNAITIGGTTHGVVTQVVLAGTAGDVSGQDITDPLNQDHTVNVERGRNAMGETGGQESVNYSIPLMQEGVDTFGLIAPGDLVRIVNQDGSKLTGLCISNNINLKTIDEVWQEVSLEIHYGDN